jgi:hypothetical protein
MCVDGGSTGPANPFEAERGAAARRPVFYPTAGNRWEMRAAFEG